LVVKITDYAGELTSRNGKEYDELKAIKQIVKAMGGKLLKQTEDSP